MEVTSTVEPKVFKTHDPMYFRNYYKQHYAQEVNCPHCNKTLTKGKLTRHIRTNKTCLLARAQAELKQLKSQPEDEVTESPTEPPLNLTWMVDARTARKL